MLSKFWSPIRTLAVFTLFACEATFAANAPALAGLAVYRDTGRDIYIAGLHTPGAQVPAGAAGIDAPASMEYRIATRRISSRGFSGTLLLQAELGSGRRAPEGVINTLSELKRAVEGSFLAGDHFLVRKTPAGSTDFYLNGAELLSVQDTAVFDFLLQGWIGESSSALLRDSLLSGRLETEMVVRFEELVPDAKRIAAVESWLIEEEAEGVEGQVSEREEAEEQLVTASEQELQPAGEVENEEENAAGEQAGVALAAAAAVKPEAEPVVVPVVAPGASVGATAEVPVTAQETATATPAPELQVPELEPEAPAPEPEDVEPPEQVVRAQPATLQPTLEPVQVRATPLDDREYQRQLSEYVSQVMNKVLRKVVYPNRAVRRQNEGSVELLAQFDGSGQVLDVSLGTSSGYKLLDGAALKAVREAGPFPQVTPVAQEEFAAGDGQSFVMAIPVRFQLFE
jgi:TonB family protein